MQLVLDLDGTITDSSSGILESMYHTFDVMGFSYLPQDQMRKFIGPPLEPAIMEFVGVDRETAEEAVRVYRAYYKDKGILGVRVYDGIPEALEALRQQGHTLHVGTSKPEVFARRIFDNIGLTAYFTHICGAEIGGGRSTKAEVLEELFRRGGVADPCSRTLTDWRMIGDRFYDVEGAAAFGMASVGVLWGFGSREEFTGAEAVVETPAALAAYFAGK